MLNKLNVSMEAINYQKGKDLFNDLIPIFEAASKNEYLDRDYFTNTDISKVVMKRTGLNIKLNAQGRGAASVGIPKLNSKNILLSNLYNIDALGVDGYRFQAEMRKHLKGTVNIRESKVDGVFSEIESPVYMSEWFLLDERFTVEEKTAVFLHEIGHLFTYYEYLIETSTTNQVLKNASEKMLKLSTNEERIIYLSSVEKDLNIKINNKKELAKTDKYEVVYTLLLSNEYSRLRSSSETNVYDIKSWEFLADQFCVRHGAGRHLALANYKMAEEDAESTRGLTTAYVLSALSVVGTVAIVSTGFIGFLLTACFFLYSPDPNSRVHDKPEQRVNRIKQDLLSELKDRSITKEHRDDILLEIEAVDTVLNNLNDHRDIITAFWDTVSPRRRKDRDEYELQQRLEGLSSNPLYVHAAKLQSIN